MSDEGIFALWGRLFRKIDVRYVKNFTFLKNFSNLSLKLILYADGKIRAADIYINCFRISYLI